MATQRYSVTPHPIECLLTWVKSGEIAIPEIQRPFVWVATKVRNLLDSLYQGYPVGFLIAWRNPSVRLKDNSKSSGKRILIDGQQRVTALMVALLGQEVLTKDHELADQCNGGAKRYGGIPSIEEMRSSLRMRCRPDGLLGGEIPSFDGLLEQRRKLMAQKIKTYF